MKNRILKSVMLAGCLLLAVGMGACRSGNAPGPATDAADSAQKSTAPQRVDIRGSIIRKQYNQGQVILEVEGLPSQNSRYNRAYVLVLPTAQITGPDGRSVDMNELQQGQNVAIMLRSGGKGNQVGMGIARRVWVEAQF